MAIEVLLEGSKATGVIQGATDEITEVRGRRFLRLEIDVQFSGREVKAVDCISLEVPYPLLHVMRYVRVPVVSKGGQGMAIIEPKKFIGKKVPMIYEVVYADKKFWRIDMKEVKKELAVRDAKYQVRPENA